jgi:hypothetical protein
MEDALVCRVVDPLLSPSAPCEAPSRVLTKFTRSHGVAGVVESVQRFVIEVGQPVQLERCRHRSILPV